jgi:hypothetical protein
MKQAETRLMLGDCREELKTCVQFGFPNIRSIS